MAETLAEQVARLDGTNGIETGRICNGTFYTDDQWKLELEGLTTRQINRAVKNSVPAKMTWVWTRQYSRSVQAYIVVQGDLKIEEVK